MAYDEQFANRIRQAFDGRKEFTERKMFGGLAFLYNGRMCCGIVGNDLMVRVPVDGFEAALRKRHVRPMDFTGKPLKGFVYVSPAGRATAASLRVWLSRGERRRRTRQLTGPVADRAGRNSEAKREIAPADDSATGSDNGRFNASERVRARA